MEQIRIVINEYLGVSAWLLLLIPLVLLVRLSRRSFLRMTLVSLTGVAICALWLSFLETLCGIEPMRFCGKLGVQLAGWLKGKTGGLTQSFIISTTLLFLWLVFAVLDAYYPEWSGKTYAAGFGTSFRR